MEQIIKLLREKENFVIASHIGPDGDAIGSCYGLAFALKKIGKKATVVLENYAPKYNLIPGREFLYRGTEALASDVFIALDCADAERMGFAKPFFDKASVTVCIDHHATNEGFADYNLIDPEASSTAEMVFGLIDAITELDKDIAIGIYAGIVTDTGGFRYSATSKSTMEIAARLMDTGIDFSEIYRELLHKHSFAATKALGLTLGSSGIAMDGRIVYACVTREMLASVGANSSEMDNVVEYLMSTKGAEVALFLYERYRHVERDDAKDAEISKDTNASKDSEDDLMKIKVSMRSRGIHVGDIAASLGGGGHRMAAGCTMVGTMDDVLKQVLDIIERELQV
ncbi:MAG: bifunctional oligoribonuclease/PAP phosphatase NrnA [Defluviitaleaceae bacterium]|nr:bifunctional oligoribonuclease/PAP phosphatase NrnA [Defluviitaleaceae bacterium]